MGRSVKDKKLCKLERKDIEKDFNNFKKIVGDPKYICKKCVRTSSSEDNLCKAKKIKQKS